jgi:hypothetical protein
MLSMLLPALLLVSSPYRPLPAEGTPAKAQPEEKRMTKAVSANGPGVADLPYAMGRRFASLDEYLLHLQRRAGPIDLPWWREIRPGVYEHVKHMPGAARETATRPELMKRFGFKR